MAKETKTVGKTTQTNQTKKGGNIMTNQDHIKRTLNIIKYQTNSYITNINKKHHTRVEYITDKELQQIIENSSNKQQIIDALVITSMLINKAKDNKVKEYYKDKAYGMPDVHPSELQPKEENNFRDQADQMYTTQKQQDIKLNTIVDNATNEDEELLDKQIGNKQLTIDEEIELLEQLKKGDE